MQEAALFTRPDARRIKHAVHAVESGLRTQKQNRLGQILGKKPILGKLDADLAFDADADDEIVFSIYMWDDDTSDWVDSGEDITGILPPINMNSGIVPKADNCDWILKAEPLAGGWRITDFPKHFWGELDEAMTSGSDTDVAVGTSVFPDVKPPPFFSGNLDSATECGIGLYADGYWYLTHLPCA
jgi:hypothetical protein